MASYGWIADMEMSAPLVSVIVDSALFHSSPHINHSASNNSHSTLFLLDSLLNCALDFVINWTEQLAVRRPYIRSERWMHNI